MQGAESPEILPPASYGTGIHFYWPYSIQMCIDFAVQKKKLFHVEQAIAEIAFHQDRYKKTHIGSLSDMGTVFILIAFFDLPNSTQAKHDHLSGRFSGFRINLLVTPSC